MSIKRLFRVLMRCVSKDKLNRAIKLMKKVGPEDRKMLCRLTNRRGCTLLFVASRSDETSFVEFLLEECGADVDQRGNYVTMAEGYDQVTPLWVAALENRFEVVKTLVQHGADVHAVYFHTEATPVHAACFLDNSVDVVKFLIENGADITQPDNEGITCLMSSVDHVELCRVLIQQGASVNAVDNYGDSALHRAIRRYDRSDTIRLLMQHGADASVRNIDGDDALRTAALSSRPSSILELLIQELKPSPETCADMYSLHAATFMGTFGILQWALPWWIKSANLRTDAEGASEARVVPNALYNFAVEAKDIDILTNISQDVEAMRMQALLVMERIIGPGHPETVSALTRFAQFAVLYDHDYQRSIDLAKYALRNMRLHTSYNLVLKLRDIYSILEIVRRDNPAGIGFADVYELLDCVVEKISKIMSSLPCLPAALAILPYMALYLVHLYCVKSCEEETSSVHQLVCALVRTNLRTVDGETLLHIAVKADEYTKDDDDKVLEAIYCYPRSAVVDCLLAAGAEVNAVDSDGSTPLHIAAFSRPTDESSTEDLEKVIKSLLQHDAHVDRANAHRQVASDRLPNVDIFPYVSLKCLAARVVRANEIPYRGTVPTTLADFVDFH